MRLHSPTFHSILKFITIHQPVRILSVLLKALYNAEKRSFLSHSNHHLDISIHGIYYQSIYYSCINHNIPQIYIMR